MKLTIRNFLHPSLSKNWKEFLTTQFIALPRDLLVLQQGRIHRPFYDKRLSRVEKVKLLKNCYESVVLKFKADVLLKLISTPGMKVCEFSTKNNERYQLILSTEIQYSREGFFTLVLLDQLGKVITIAFSIDFSKDKPRLLIGSLQATAHDGLNRIRFATHEMFGLQPRIFLVHILKLFSKSLGVKEIEAISDKNHVYNSLRYRRRSKNKFQSYDIFWEQVGKSSENGNFNIDVDIHRKAIEEYPSKKRSEYRKRFALLDEIEEQLNQFVTMILI